MPDQMDFYSSHLAMADTVVALSSDGMVYGIPSLCPNGLLAIIAICPR